MDKEHISLAEITARHCPPSVQPLVKVGGLYPLIGRETLKDGTPVAIVAHTTEKGKTMRINEKRFSWRVVSMEDLASMQREKEARRCQNEVHRQLSYQEKARVTIVPLMIDYIAWHYAMKAADKAVSYKLDMMKKVTREVRRLRKEYDSDLLRTMDPGFKELVERETDKFMDICQKDFTILYFSVNQAFKKAMPTWPCDDLRSYAIIALLMMDYCECHEDEMLSLVAKAIGKPKPFLRLPAMRGLRKCMEAYAAEMGKFDYNDRNVRLAMRVIKNDMDSVEFGNDKQQKNQ